MSVFNLDDAFIGPEDYAGPSNSTVTVTPVENRKFELFYPSYTKSGDTYDDLSQFVTFSEES